MQTTSKVGGLTEAQVNSLLSLGLEHKHRAVQTALELLQQAISEPGRPKLKLLLSDLQSPIFSTDSGLLSFARLTGIPETEMKLLESESFLTALVSPQTSRSTLGYLALFGELLSEKSFPEATRLASSVIRILAKSIRSKRFGIPLDAPDAEAVAATMQALATTQTFPKELWEKM